MSDPIAAPPKLSIEQRQATLRTAINNYTALGYRVINQTDSTAQLVRPKQFSCLIASLSLLCFGVGVLFYIFFFMAMKDAIVFIAVDDYGTVSYNGFVPRARKAPTPISVQFAETRDAFLRSTVGMRLSELWNSGSGGKLSVLIGVGAITAIPVVTCGLLWLMMTATPR